MTLPTGRRRTRNAEPFRRAFTLIELILVMAMLAVVIAVAAPSLSRFFRGRTLDSEARRFLALTHYGQSRAVSEGIPMTLWINTREGAYGLEEAPGYEDYDTKARSYELAKDLEMEVLDNLTLNNAALNNSTFNGGAVSGGGFNSPAFSGSVSNQANIWFLPDGAIGENSPLGVHLAEKDRDAEEGSSLWLIQSDNRLTYEIRSETEFESRAGRRY